jgi:ADP-dependent NAD(P)H-hydrate dehydratase / NAD(P)H-hydrate epimerase
VKLFTTNQIRDIDAYTIEHEPISSTKLIERVAESLYAKFIEQFDSSKTVAIVAGKGNNGSDAIAMALLLRKKGFNITVFAYNSAECKYETKYYLDRIKSETIEIFAASRPKQFDVIIDGLFGTGLSKPISGIEKEIIETINKSQAIIVSIDIPSGLQGDTIADTSQVIVNADFTYTLEFPKLACLFPENGKYIGELTIIPIGLHPAAKEQTDSIYSFVEFNQIKLQKRDRFAHKGSFGHVFSVAGSLGKMGASILSSKASITIGAGLVTAHIPKCGTTIMQTAVPEVMASIDSEENYISSIPLLTKISSIALGPGIGTELATQKAIIDFISENRLPTVIDADALNCIALQNATNKISKNTIITPHVKEFERLFGDSIDSKSRLELQIENSKKLQIYIILKGYRTSITTPDGQVYFNSTGNPGMATAGSGDVLTGIIAGLLAQGYSHEDAAIFGVYIHGLAGDFAAEALTENCVTAGNIIQ